MGVHTVSRIKTAAGFTLVELVVVLIIMTIILAVTIPRFATREEFDARGFVEQTLSAIRYAQKFAVASGCDVEVNVTTTGYSLKQRAGLTGPDCHSASAFSDNVSDPSLSGAFAGNTPSGISVSGAPVSFYYDKIGRPNDPVLGTPLTSTVSITVSGAGTGWTLTVEPETGYVHL